MKPPQGNPLWAAIHPLIYAVKRRGHVRSQQVHQNDDSHALEQQLRSCDRVAEQENTFTGNCVAEPVFSAEILVLVGGAIPLAPVVPTSTRICGRLKCVQEEEHSSRVNMH